ncbi:MAG TPA: hypothetical protein VL053_11200 [Arachidicoccus sp.]|nr:hypothetical protein [Arachidicoccus sp.]
MPFATINAQVNPRQFGKSADSLITVRLPDIAPGGVVLLAKDGKVFYRKALVSQILKRV